MKTNLDKWNYYFDLINQKDEQFINDNIKDRLTIVYHISGWFSDLGVAKECTIKRYFYSHGSNGLYYYTKKPVRSDIAKIKAYYESNFVRTLENIYIDYIEYHDKYSTSSAFKFIELDVKDFFTDKSVADEKSKVILKLRDEKIAFQELHKKDKNYKYGENAYKFLGWQNGWRHVYFDKDGNETTDPKLQVSFGYTKRDYPEYGLCRELNHQVIEVSHNMRGSENTVSCPICKIYWKYDSSD